jgi:hypothetical protein
LIIELEVVGEWPAEIDVPPAIRREIDCRVKIGLGVEAGISGSIVKRGRELHSLTWDVKER